MVLGGPSGRGKTYQDLAEHEQSPVAVAGRTNGATYQDLAEHEQSPVAGQMVLPAKLQVLHCQSHGQPEVRVHLSQQLPTTEVTSASKFEKSLKIQHHTLKVLVEENSCPCFCK